MILDARDALYLDLSCSVLVGDRDSDIAAGIAAGVKHNLRLAHTEKRDPDRLVFPSLRAIRDWLEQTCGAQPSERQALPERTGLHPDPGK